MFLYNVYHIIRQKELKSYIQQEYSTKIANETSYLLPKQIKRPTEDVFLIPQRYILAVMGFLAVVNAYTMRITLSVAITEMVLVHSNESHAFDPEACEGSLTNTTNTVTDPDKLYPWTSSQQGLILSSFYWGYVLTHIPGGIIAERFGGKLSLGLGILCTSIFTFITPFIIYLTDGKWFWVVLVRLIEGLGEGTTFPALNVLLAQWVPLTERSKLGTLVFAGSQIGTVVGNSLSGILISTTKDWASVFYVFGSFGILWVFIWMVLCYNDPDSHPFISEKEQIYLREQIVNVSKKKKIIPWKAILTSAPLWALVAAQIGHDWGFFTMVTDLPKYMKDILKYNVKENGVLSSIPYIFMWFISLTSGYFCDYLIKHEYLAVTTCRKLFTTTASLGPALFIIAASYSGCNRNLAVVFFTIGMSFMGTFYCGMKVNALDLSPNFAGTLMAIVNGIGGLTGIIVPYLVGAFTEDHTLAQWRTVFWIAFGVFLITNIIFLLFSSGDIQPWNTISGDDDDRDCDNKHKDAVKEYSEKC